MRYHFREAVQAASPTWLSRQVPHFANARPKPARRPRVLARWHTKAATQGDGSCTAAQSSRWRASRGGDDPCIADKQRPRGTRRQKSTGMGSAARRQKRTLCRYRCCRTRNGHYVTAQQLMYVGDQLIYIPGVARDESIWPLATRSARPSAACACCGASALVSGAVRRRCCCNPLCASGDSATHSAASSALANAPRLTFLPPRHTCAWYGLIPVSPDL
jgi:hypothetical protein